MPVKKLFDVGQRGLIFFIYISYLTRESTLYFLNVNKYWHDSKRWEKEANLFKVVKWKSCFILLRGILVMWYGSQTNAPNYTKSKQTLTR